MRFACLAAILLAGCAGPATQLRRDKAVLAEDVADLRAQLRKDQRQIRDLQTENLLLRDKMETAEVQSGRVGVPRLPVEIVEPDAEAPGDDVRAEYGDDAMVVGVDSDGNEIVYVGDAASGKTVSYDDADLGGDDDVDDLEYAPDDGDGDDVEAPAPKPKKPKARPAAKATSDDVAVAYEDAVALVKAKDHEGAIAALRAFLVEHPRHDLADNAQYWLGEVYYDAKDWGRALIEFRATVEKYAKGNKVPDALLKMGYCYGSLGQTAKARAALEQVVETYPKSQPAALAAKRLETM